MSPQTDEEDCAAPVVQATVVVDNISKGLEDLLHDVEFESKFEKTDMFSKAVKPKAATSLFGGGDDDDDAELDKRIKAKQKVAADKKIAEAAEVARLENESAERSRKEREIKAKALSEKLKAGGGNDKAKAKPANSSLFADEEEEGEDDGPGAPDRLHGVYVPGDAVEARKQVAVTKDDSLDELFADEEDLSKFSSTATNKSKAKPVAAPKAIAQKNVELDDDLFDMCDEVRIAIDMHASLRIVCVFCIMAIFILNDV